MKDDARAAQAISGGTHSVMFDLKLLTQFNEDHPQATVLAETGVAQIVLLALRAGQACRDVRTPSQIIAQCLRGRANLVIAEVTQPLRAGLVTLIEGDTSHSFVATTDCVLLLTLTPSPELHPHAMLAASVPLVTRV